MTEATIAQKHAATRLVESFEASVPAKRLSEGSRILAHLRSVPFWRDADPVILATPLTIKLKTGFDTLANLIERVLASRDAALAGTGLSATGLPRSTKALRALVDQIPSFEALPEAIGTRDPDQFGFLERLTPLGALGVSAGILLLLFLAVRS